MSDVIPEIRMIPISAITILNPRSRNKRIFNELVASIAQLGLKKPITVSPTGDDKYSLVCGQGRLEAFVALGQTAIPAVVIEASKEDCHVMSLVENIARRQHTSLELMREMGALKKRGYSVAEIAAKTGFSTEYTYATCYLLEHGEERLLAGVERGLLPASIAMEIAQAKEADVQQALADAYEKGTLPGNQALAIRKIIEQRNAIGKAMQSGPPQNAVKRITAEALVRAYRKEAQRQALLVKKATLTQSRLIFIVTALRKLFQEEHLVAILKSEALHTLPRPLAQRFAAGGE
jgi:ParB family transcriptional regulator, chromosome partitioning protein